ncbi:MAG: hypothetical protein V3U78_02135, partial [Thiotrichaceae bacterium]
AGKPELGAMNRFREGALQGIQGQGVKAKWLLASAYQLAGQSDAAKNIVQGLVADPNAKTEQHSETFSTHLSDLGLQLNALTTLGKTQDAEHFVQAIADELAKNSHNTHGIAWALMAVSRHVSDQGDTAGIGEREATKNALKAEFSIGNQDFTQIKSKKAYLSQPLGEISSDTLNIKVKNTAATKLYTSIISKGIPQAGDEADISDGLELAVYYGNPENHKDIDLSAPIKQGQDIQIVITVKNTSGQALENIALSHLIPSGMEIHNANYKRSSKTDYQDVRDDRIYSYFSLNADETKHFSILVNPAYTGRFYLPAVTAEAMYKSSIRTLKQGRWIEITPRIDSKPSAETNTQAKSVIGASKNAEIAVEKCWLYDEANQDSKSKMYLVKGDKVNILKRSNDWVLVRYEGKKTIEKWIESNAIK